MYVDAVLCSSFTGVSTVRWSWDDHTTDKNRNLMKLKCNLALFSDFKHTHNYRCDLLETAFAHIATVREQRF